MAAVAALGALALMAIAHLQQEVAAVAVPEALRVGLWVVALVAQPRPTSGRAPDEQCHLQTHSLLSR